MSRTTHALTSTLIRIVVNEDTNDYVETFNDNDGNKKQLDIFLDEFIDLRVNDFFVHFDSPISSCRS